MNVDRIRDEDLDSLIKWASVSNDLVLRALTELKERREEENKRNRTEVRISFKWHCEQCGKMNLFNWQIDDYVYFDWYDPLRCDYCKKDTIIGTQPYGF